MTLDEYMQKHGDEVIEDLKQSIDELDIPENFKEQFKNILDDNDFDIMEHNYNILKSDYEDRMIEDFKMGDV